MEFKRCARCGCFFESSNSVCCNCEAKDKQDMIKNLVKEVPTEKLNESIQKYIPMILSNSSEKSINKSERVLKENRKPIYLTGDNKNNKVAMDLNKDLSSQDVDAEIAKVIANGKFNF